MNYLFILLYLIFVLSSCNYPNDKFLGVYKAFFYETSWQVELLKDNQFSYISGGHLGGSKYQGKYKVSEDTIFLLSESMEDKVFLYNKKNCLIEIETRFDFCKTHSETWGSSKRDINYPQLKTKNSKLKKDMEWMLQTALRNKKIPESLSDTTKTLIIQEYYEVTKKAKLKLEYYGKPVIFLSEKEIKKLGVKEYLVIDEISIGLTFAKIDFSIPSAFPTGTLDFFTKENGKWIHNQNF